MALQCGQIIVSGVTVLAHSRQAGPDAGAEMGTSVGAPQCGHAAASVLTVPAHSRQVASAIVGIPSKNLND
jgi:hypothetical protein